MEYIHRYDRNMHVLSLEEMSKIHDARICVIGCGGLGGYIIEMLARLGIGHLVVVDGGVFDETNLNRQILCEESLLGTSKALAAKTRIAKINSDVKVTAINENVTPANRQRILEGCDLVMDGLDNMSIRKVMEDACNKANIPLIHGAIAGWFGQVATIYPGPNILDKIYPGNSSDNVADQLGSPAFTPALVASIEVAEAVKVLLNKGVQLKSRMLTIDLLLQEYEVFDL